MELPKAFARAGIGLDDYRRLSGKLYEVEPQSFQGKEAPSKAEPAAKGVPAAPPEKKPPQRTAGQPSRSRKDPIPSAGVELQTRIKELAGELRKKYGLPRDTGERPPPPPPEEKEPAAKPTASDSKK